MSEVGPRPVFLVGFMGSGKSATGRELARIVGFEFVDTDELVVASEGRPIEEIFRESGEGAFREAEWRALRSVAGRRGLVVATGGGAFLGTVQRSFMKSEGTTVWLDVPYEVARTRVGPGAGRPLWNPEQDEIAFRALFERRRAAYALAHVRVDAAAGGPAELARQIADRIFPRRH
jgi:shikimate kinase